MSRVLGCSHIPVVVMAIEKAAFAEMIGDVLKISSVETNDIS